MKCSTVDIYSLVQKLIPKLTRNDVVNIQFNISAYWFKPQAITAWILEKQYKVPCVQRLWVNKHDYVINRSTLLTLEMHLNVMITATHGGYGYISSKLDQLLI